MIRGPFREEALRHHEARGRRGAVLRLTPTWAERAFWLTSAALLCSLAFAALGSVNEYATGPAVIRVDNDIEVRAPSGGLVDAVEARLGLRVRAGSVLARLHAGAERADLERARQRLDAQLERMLRHPGDAAARQTVGELRAQLEAAQARVDERVLVAPQDGIVTELRVRPGQLIAPGELVATLLTGAARFSVVALLPGSARPQLAPGMPLRLELNGYRHAFAEARIETISHTVVGPNEARRYLGGEVGDAIKLEGPLAVVVARLQAGHFSADGVVLDYYAGMGASASARLRRRRILSLFVPWLPRFNATVDHAG